MGIEAGFGAMMRLYESKAARNALLRLANTKAGTPAYERALNHAATAVRPLLANEAPGSSTVSQGRHLFYSFYEFFIKSLSFSGVSSKDNFYKNRKNKDSNA